MQLYVNDSISISLDASNLIPYSANSKEDFVEVDELDGRKLLEFEEPMPSLIVSSPTRLASAMSSAPLRCRRLRRTSSTNGSSKAMPSGGLPMTFQTFSA
jgi:hypothetical protein